MRRMGTWIKGAVSILFFVVLFRNLCGGFMNALREIDPLFLALSFAVTAIIVPASCLKWKVVIDMQGDRVSFRELLRIYLVGYMFSNLLPSNVGGDVARSYYAGLKIGSQSRAAVSVFMERFTGILALLILAILSPLMCSGLYGRPLVYITASVSALFLAAFVCLARMRNPTNAAKRMLSCFMPGKRLEKVRARLLTAGERFLEKLGHSVKCLFSDRKSLFRVTALTLFFYLMTWVNVYVAFRAFGVDLNFLHTAALVPTAMLIAMAPVGLLGNLGFSEGIYVVVFALGGFLPAESLAMGLLLRLKLLAVGAAGYFFYLAGPRGKVGVYD